MPWFVRLPDMQQPDKMKYTLKAAPATSAIELKNQKSAKAKRILVGADVHFRGYQTARKIDNGDIGVVENFRSEEAPMLYVDKQCERAEQVVVVYEAGPDQKPDPTWTIRLLGYAEGMADPYLQELWGEGLGRRDRTTGFILASDFGLFERDDAKGGRAFVAACQYLVWTPHYRCIPRNVTFLHGSDFTLRDFTELAETGLFQETELSIDPFGVGAKEYYFGFSDAALAVTEVQTLINRVRHNPGLSIWLLTKSGRDLTKFFLWETPNGYVENFRKGIRKMGWESRIGKIADYSNPSFEESN